MRWRNVWPNRNGTRSAFWHNESSFGRWGRRWQGEHWRQTVDREHRGTKEIGRTCIEVKVLGKRIALDVGLPLDAPNDEDTYERLLQAVPEFWERDDSLRRSGQHILRQRE